MDFTMRNKKIALAISLIAITSGYASATTIWPIGDSITEGLSENATAATILPYADNVPGYINVKDYVKFTPLATYQNGTIATDLRFIGAVTMDQNFWNDSSKANAFCLDFARYKVTGTGPDGKSYQSAYTGGYRTKLLANLPNSSSYSFTGSVTDLNSLKHDGHGAWWPSHINQCVGTWMSLGGVTSPNIVLLLIGTNNLDQSAQVGLTYNQIKAKYSNARIIVGLIPRRHDDTAYNARIYNYNEGVIKATGLNSPCGSADTANMGTLTIPTDNYSGGSEFQDGVHPNTSGYSRMARVWAKAITAPGCNIESRTVVRIGGQLVESISTNGRYFNFDMPAGGFSGGGIHSGWVGQLINNPSSGAARFFKTFPNGSSPCLGADTCKFTTRTFYNELGTGRQLESITVGSKYFNYDGETPVASGDVLYIYANAFTPVSVDTRAISTDNGYYTHRVTIGNTGYDTQVLPNGGQTLVRQFALNTEYPYICSYASSPSNCKFDTRNFYVNDAGVSIESITAYGRIWDINATTRAVIQTAPLTSVSRFTNNW